MTKQPSNPVSSLTPSERAFMRELAELLTPWGWSQNIAQLFAYLLIRTKPVTLDEIAADLEISKGNASIAARKLEKHGNAIRLKVPGTKRLLYSAPERRAGPFADQAALFGTLGALLESYAKQAEQRAVKQRLAAITKFLSALQTAVEGVLNDPAFGD